MENLFDEKESVETKADTNTTPKQSWKEWLNTDESVRWVYLIFGLFAILLLMIMMQFSTKAICCGDWDGYYHIRWSSLLWDSFKSGHWLPEFKWLPLTVLNPQDYADHHFLFHLLQIPFLWFFEPVMAAKVATVFYATLAIFSVYWLMFRYKVDYMLIWLGALLTCANPFFYRMNMAKAPPLTIIYTILGIYLLWERKYIWLLPLMFVFVWTYSLYPVLFGLAVIWFFIILWNERKIEWQPVAYTFAGLILGNVINPYFPQNIGLFVEHFLTKFKAGGYAVAVGGEWYPYESLDLLTHFPVALIAMLIGYILYSARNGKLPEKVTLLLSFSTLLLIAQCVSKRYAEYFPPFAILFVAFSWREFIKPTFLQLPEDFQRDIQPYLDADKLSEKETTWATIKQSLIWVLGAVLLLTLFHNVVGVKIGKYEQEGMTTTIRNNEENDKYQRAMNWAVMNIPEGERIFNCNWDDFPKMFFYDQKHSYVYGLDPNYLYTKNPELSKQIGDITGGKIDDPAPIIRDQYGAKWIFSDAKENEDFIAKCLDSGWCEKTYEDDEAIILKIRDQKGEPPTEDVDENQLTPDEKKQLDAEEANDKANAKPDNEDDDDN